MEQGIIAVGIGLFIFLMGVSYGFNRGFNRGQKNGISLGSKIGIELGTFSIYSILLKSGVIKVKYNEYDRLNYEIHGDSDNSITYGELISLINSSYEQDTKNG